MHLISLAIIMVLGGATLFFHNPWFIKWKPTGIYWFSALVFFSSSYIGSKPLIQKMMEANVTLMPKSGTDLTQPGPCFLFSWAL